MESFESAYSSYDLSCWGSCDPEPWYRLFILTYSCCPYWSVTTQTSISGWAAPTLCDLTQTIYLLRLGPHVFPMLLASPGSSQKCLELFTPFYLTGVYYTLASFSLAGCHALLRDQGLCLETIVGWSTCVKLGSLTAGQRTLWFWTFHRYRYSSLFSNSDWSFFCSPLPRNSHLICVTIS